MLPAGTGQKDVEMSSTERLQKRVIRSAAVNDLFECAFFLF